MMDTNMKIIFQNSTPKIPKLGILGANFKVFYFWTKFCNLTNSIALNSNMIVDFKISTPKIESHFWYKILFFSFVFYHDLKCNRFERVDFKYDNTYNIPFPEYPN